MEIIGINTNSKAVGIRFIVSLFLYGTLEFTASTTVG